MFVPVEGSYASSVAAELALHLAEATGATLTLGLLSETRLPAAWQERPVSAINLSDELARISPVFCAVSTPPELVTLAYDATRRNVVAEIVRGRYDLVVLGAENSAVRQPLFFGHENEAIMRLDTVTTLVLVPLRQRTLRASANGAAA